MRGGQLYWSSRCCKWKDVGVQYEIGETVTAAGVRRSCTGEILGLLNTALSQSSFGVQYGVMQRGTGVEGRGPPGLQLRSPQNEAFNPLWPEVDSQHC